MHLEIISALNRGAADGSSISKKTPDLVLEFMSPYLASCAISAMWGFSAVDMELWGWPRTGTCINTGDGHP